MNHKWTKRPTPASEPATVIVCGGSELALVLGKIRRMNRTASEPQKIGIDKWQITLGAPCDDFRRRPIDDTETIDTFNPHTWR